MPLSRRQLLLALGSSTALALIPKLQAGSTVRIVEFDSAGNSKGVETVEKVVKPNAEWKKQLTPEQFDVTRREGTEPAFTGKYAKNHDSGIYRCICCATALFNSDTKFESGTGWPSFWAPIAKENVTDPYRPQLRHGTHRSEVHPLRRASRARVRRWTEAHRPALLHEFRGLEFRTESEGIIT